MLLATGAEELAIRPRSVTRMIMAASFAMFVSSVP